MTKRKSEYNRFEALAGRVFAVPHREVKAKLQKEEIAKKRKKSKSSSASREGA